jgi:hypothetical protein
MALEKTVTTPHGFNANNAYHRVEAVSLTQKDKICFAVRSYKSVQDPAFTESFMECAYDLEGKNPIKQAYEYVKTLEEFADAKDC